jgi:hypothetical protein
MKSWRRDEQPRLLGFEQVAAERASGAEDSGRTPAAVAANAAGASVADSGGVNADLVGRSFSDRGERVTVESVSRANPAQVVVRRERDGHRWAIHAGIVRMILPPQRTRRRAA